MASGELSRRVEKWLPAACGHGQYQRWEFDEARLEAVALPISRLGHQRSGFVPVRRRGAGETRATHSSASRTGAPTGASWPPRGRTSGARTRGSGEAAQSTPSAVAPGTLSAAWPRWVATRRSLRRRRWDCVASKRLARRLGFRPGGVLEVLMHERNGHAASSSRTARAWRRSGSTRPATTRSPARCSATCSCAAACTPSLTPRRSRS